MSSPHEDLGYAKPQVNPSIQMARDYTAHVLRICSGKNQHEQICIERESYQELHQKYPTKGIDRVLREEKRFHP